MRQFDTNSTSSSPASCSTAASSPFSPLTGVHKNWIKAIEETLYPLWVLNPGLDVHLIHALVRRSFPAEGHSLNEDVLAEVRKGLMKQKSKMTARIGNARKASYGLATAVGQGKKQAFELICTL